MTIKGYESSGRPHQPDVTMNVSLRITDMHGTMDSIKHYLDTGGQLTSEHALGLLAIQRSFINVRNQSIRKDLDNKTPYTTISRRWKISSARIAQLKDNQ